MNYKFPRKSHLITEAQFKKVYKARQKISSEIFTIYYCYNNTVVNREAQNMSKKEITLLVERKLSKLSL